MSPAENASPIFIVGCGHSGTSILLTILGAHSRLCAIPWETSLAFRKSVPDDTTTRLLADFDALVVREGKRRWIEKTPRHIMHLDRLLDLFPTAKILIVIRDGRDVACSIQDRFGNLIGGITRWVRENRAGQKYWTHPRVHCLRYECLIVDPVGTLTDIMTFLDEQFEPTMLLYFNTPKYYYADLIEKPIDVTGANHSLYRNWQINQPLFDGRGKWLRMSESEKTVIKDRAGAMLIEYGYATDLDW